MKKGFLLNVLAILVLTLSAEARVVRLVGNGTGGTTHGDKEAACQRGYERAEDDAYNQCYRRDGDVLDSYEESCRCRKKPGSRDDYNCDATVRVSCEVACRPEQTQFQGNGLGIDYNSSVARDDAFRRAEDDARLSCSRRGGFVVWSEEISNTCRRTSTGEYECRSNVRSTCELNNCR
ncbi:MAG: hypothetical protein R3A80_01430 [Bdellovibrionota bacterium]